MTHVTQCSPSSALAKSVILRAPKMSKSELVVEAISSGARGGGNVYADCAGFETSVDRRNELNRCSYEWNGVIDTFRLPLSDKLRETHPDLRPPGAEPLGHPCQSHADCDAALGSDSGASCIGKTAEGLTCKPEIDGCTNMGLRRLLRPGPVPDPNCPPELANRRLTLLD